MAMLFDTPIPGGAGLVATDIIRFARKTLDVNVNQGGGSQLELNFAHKNNSEGTTVIGCASFVNSI